MSLASLKQVTSELNSDYKNLENQVDSLGCSVKEMSLCDHYNSSKNTGLSRTSSLSSFVDNLSERETTETESSELESEYDDLDSTYIFVRGNPDGTASEEEIERAQRLPTWRNKKRSSIGTASNSSADSYDSYSSSEGYHCINENEKIIKSLQKSWTINPQGF
jgi:hypothetical protein